MHDIQYIEDPEEEDVSPTGAVHLTRWVPGFFRLQMIASCQKTYALLLTKNIAAFTKKDLE
jgi:hypothetical protein